MIRHLFPASVFLLCLLIGYQTGASLDTASLIKNNQPVSPYSGLVAGTRTSTPGKPPATLPNGQRNILLVQADDLKSGSPRLESVWLLSYVANNTRLTFLPVFPGQADMGVASGQSLPDLFELRSYADRLALSAGFLEALRPQIPWWSSYIVMDATALARMVEITSAGSRGRVDGRKVLAGLPHAWEDPRAAQDGQAALYQEICWQASHSEVGLGLDGVIERYPGHILSDLEQDYLLAEVRSLSNQMGTFSCEFPTLAGLRTVR
jgi:hypothetical protein